MGALTQSQAVTTVPCPFVWNPSEFPDLHGGQRGLRTLPKGTSAQEYTLRSRTNPSLQVNVYLLLHGPNSTEHPENQSSDLCFRNDPKQLIMLCKKPSTPDEDAERSLVQAVAVIQAQDKPVLDTTEVPQNLECLPLDRTSRKSHQHYCLLLPSTRLILYPESQKVPSQYKTMAPRLIQTLDSSNLREESPVMEGRLSRIPCPRALTL